MLYPGFAQVNRGDSAEGASLKAGQKLVTDRGLLPPREAIVAGDVLHKKLGFTGVAPGELDAQPVQP